MARIIRIPTNLSHAVGTAKTHTFGTTTGQYTSLEQNLRAPYQGARVAKWWITKLTVGTGTTNVTAYLVASGGTSSTRQISDPIVIDIDATVPTYQEAGASNDPYILATVTDQMNPPDINFTSSTTATNAPTGISVGIVWAL